jgi:manganese/zinc/iron transport system permease protein
VDGIAILRDLVHDYTLRTVALGTTALGVVSGALGAFAVLRRQSLLGDAIAHAALPGIALAWLVTRSKAPLVLVVGAAIAGWVATLLVMAVVRTTRIKEDSALGLVLSVFFGLGLVLLTRIQDMPDAGKAGLDRFLFGQAATLLQRDVLTVVALGCLTLAVLVLFWKEFKLLSFDPQFGASLGFPMRRLDVLLTTLIVIAIVVGLRTVGVVLMSAMIVAPGAAARQWTDRLGVMVALAAAFGALAGVSGAVISSTAHVPTGPAVVVCVSVIVVLSLTMAPHRGLVWQWAARMRNSRRLQAEAVLLDLYTLALQHRDADHAHSVGALRAMRAASGGEARSLRKCAARGWVRPVGPGRWALTAEGVAQAERVARELGRTSG